MIPLRAAGTKTKPFAKNHTVQSQPAEVSATPSQRRGRSNNVKYNVEMN